MNAGYGGFETPWALATLDAGDGPVAALETPQGLFGLRPSLARVGFRPVDTVQALFDDWPAARAALDAAAACVSDEDGIQGSVRLAPLLAPGKILCAGANYHAHLEEMGVTAEQKASHRLFFFMKPVATALVGPGPTVRMPLDCKAFDWEVELAAVIGRTVRAVDAVDALSCIAGYTLAIDFTARDLTRVPGAFFTHDWVAGKAHDTSCPVGPRMVPAGAIGDPQNVPLKLTVNGVVKQDDTTADMIDTVAEQVARASRIMTLNPGDILLTGTPAGVGAPRKDFLKAGDVVEVSSPLVGRFSVSILDPVPASPVPAELTRA